MITTYNKKAAIKYLTPSEIFILLKKYNKIENLLLLFIECKYTFVSVLSHG